MKNKKLTFALVIIGVVTIGAVLSYPGHLIAVKESKTKAIVARVIDGDTVELTTGERVRLLGMDADEMGGKCYEEARDRLKELIEGKEVILERDVTDKDRYGRLLRYIFVDDTFVNVVLVREGLATVYTVKPDTKYLEQFERALLLAREEGGCVWGS